MDSDSGKSEGTESTNSRIVSEPSSDKSNSNDESSNNKSPISNSDIDENSDKIPQEVSKKGKYTPILASLNSIGEDITQKIIIIYGLAASLYKIHEDNSTSVNITPNYIYIDEDLCPYIDLEKLNSDSKKQNAEYFLLSNKEFYPYFPKDINKSDFLISNNIQLRKKVDSYIFGSICFSIMAQMVIADDTDAFGLSFDFNLNGTFSNGIFDLIRYCLDESHIHRPMFYDILYMIDSFNFLNELEDFDMQKFKNYQKTVIGEEFIQPINPDFDIADMPEIKRYRQQDFKKGNQIGRGLSGEVFKATKKDDTSVIVAYKKFNDTVTKNNLMRIYREIKILATVNHYAVQGLYGYVKGNKSEISVLTLFEKRGSLINYINKRTKEYKLLDFTQKIIIMYGIAAGMNYLHKEGIAHRDLKPENVLLNNDFEPLITDFGLSKKISKDEFLQSIHNTGSPSYMAPELWEGSSTCSLFTLYDARCADVYSFSILVYVLFTGEVPWKSLIEAQTNVPVGVRPQIPETLPKPIALLIQACWADDPQMRPTFEVILQMIGHSAFIENIGNDLDIERFKEYQKKVVSEEFLSDNLMLNENQSIILFNGIRFPQIPKEKIFTYDDFEDLTDEKEESTQLHPFFNIQKVTKDSLIFNRYEVKEEYYNYIDIIDRFKIQIEMLLNVNHPVFIPFYGIINIPPVINYKEDAKDIYDIFPQGDIKPPSLIMPYVSKGSIIDHHKSLSITQKFIILYGIAAGMYYLYKKEIAYLNLKPENILLNDNFEPIINIDITSRKKREKEKLINFLPVFSFPYVAPELLNFQNAQHRNINEKLADVYSFSMIAYFLLSGIHPWDSSRGFQPILKKLMEEKRPHINSIVPPFDKLIQDCWSTNPNDRPSFKKILKRLGSIDFIRKIEFLDLEQFQTYQKKVVGNEFIFPIQICPIRKRNEFELKEEIGNGKFGNIYLYVDKTNGNQVIFKEIPSDYQDFVEKHKKVLSTVNFPSLISTYGFIEPEGDEKKSVILTPYASKNLESIIEGGESLKYTTKCIIMYGIAMGMYKLHLHDIAHQDLKPQNILFNEELEPKIADFAISKFVSPTQLKSQSLSIGSSYYMAPEAYFSKQKYDEKLADVYSFGMLVYYLMSQIQPFENTRNVENLMKNIADGKRPSSLSVIPKKMMKLIKSCWNSNPSSRPSFDKIVEMISDPDFYTFTKMKFDDRLFYEYQVKLGEPQFIKFSQEKIKKYQLAKRKLSISVDFIQSLHIFAPEAILLDQADKHNNAESQYRLGCMYRNGKTVQKNYEKAAKYFKKAAKQDHIDAIIEYAICFKKGIGVSIDEDKAFKMIQKAIDLKSIDALVILAKWYCSGFPRKYKKAFKLLQEADQNGHPDAPALIGSLIEHKKIETELADTDVIEYYKRSCSLGSYEGMYRMAIHYHYGIGIEPNQSEAIRLYILSTNSQYYNHNQIPAVYLLSKLYEETKEYEYAYKLADYYRKEDKFIGHLLCSDFFSRGIGVEKNESLAKKHFEAASDKKFINDQCKFAYFVLKDLKSKNNEEEFIKWITIAAENGSSNAQADLCRFYRRRLNDSEENLNEAKIWGQKSADAGNQQGIWNLSRLYKYSKDPKNEAICLEKAAANGSTIALVKLGMNYKRDNKNKEAVDKFKEAAERKSPAGIFHYGNELFSGTAITQNVEKGLEMIKKAAEAGCRRAVKKLVSIYSKGLEGVDKNEEIAESYKLKLEQMPRRFSRHLKHQNDDDC